MFSSRYQRSIRRRKIIFRTLGILAAFVVITVTYDKSAIPNLKKIAGSLVSSIKSEVKNDINKPAEDSLHEKTEAQNDEAEQIKGEKDIKEQGSYTFKLSDTESIEIVYEKKDGSTKFTGIKPDNLGVFFDIRYDGNSIVFDNPKTSDIWVCSMDGNFTKINPDSYIQHKDDGSYKEYKKSDIMVRYSNNYVWASKPKFLKDGRIVYQSYLPWFINVNTYYIWIANIDGTNNRMLLGTGQVEPVKYSGYTDDGMLIIEYGGKRYVLNADNRSKQMIE